MLEATKERASRRFRGDDSGFTLIELLVVIVILAILAAIVVFAVGGITDKGQTSACKADKKTIQTAEEAFYAAQTTSPKYTDVAGLVAASFLTETPTLHTVTTAPGGATYTITAMTPAVNGCTT
ncbi:MAG TPA: prepilin-type N-terminal cleavage/methylation domain-containing protein [Acidimicrobiales bacterium]|jgi:general secretion pathway protein G